MQLFRVNVDIYTGYTQKNGAVSKVNKTIYFSPYTGATYTVSSGNCPVLVRYQQFFSHAYCAAASAVSKMASQQEKAFCVLRFEVSRSVITVQGEFRVRFRKDAPCMVYILYIQVVTTRL